MTTVLSDLTDVFQNELNSKEEAFQVAQAHLQSATRELALRRRRITEGQTRLSEREEAKLRRENLTQALREELSVDQSVEGAGIDGLIEQCLAYEETVKEKDNGAAMKVDEDSLSPKERFQSDIPFEEGPTDEVVKLRWLKSWYEASVEGLEGRIRGLEGASATKLSQCRKVVAMCCNVPESKVEGMLDELVTAIESIGDEGVDLPRLAGFLSKVKKGSDSTPRQAPTPQSKGQAGSPILDSSASAFTLPNGSA